MRVLLWVIADGSFDILLCEEAPVAICLICILFPLVIAGVPAALPACTERNLVTELSDDFVSVLACLWPRAVLDLL